MNQPKVLFFDVNETLLDLKPIKEKVGSALGNQPHLVKLWFTTMLQYSLVETVAGKYHHFGEIGAATLQMVAANNQISISEDEAKELIIPTLRSLPPHPEVVDALARLKQAGYKMISITNSSLAGVTAQFKHAELTQYFDDLLSVEKVEKFKPHPDIYNWATQQAGEQPGDCLLVAAHGWDIAGAKWAGWQTAFLSRPGAHQYPLAGQADYIASDLTEFADQIIQ